jgi:hypothetical protein
MKITKDFKVEVRFIPTTEEEGLERTMRFFGILFPEAVRLAKLEEAEIERKKANVFEEGLGKQPTVDGDTIMSNLNQ